LGVKKKRDIPGDIRQHPGKFFLDLLYLGFIRLIHHFYPFFAVTNPVATHKW
jgi:hypothetical protein